MTSPDREGQRLLERLGALGVPVQDGPVRERRRERMVRAIDSQADHVHARQHRRARWQNRAALVALAASVALVVAAWTMLRDGTHPAPATAAADAHFGRVVVVNGTARVIRPGHSQTNVTGEFDVHAGDRIDTGADSRLRLSLQQRVRVTLFGDSELRLPKGASRGREQLELGRGEAEFDVAPLPAGRSFAVVTPDAEVVVHGTRFTVRVSGTEPTLVTDVSVSEGRVGVKHAGRTVMLAPGQIWTSAPGAAGADRIVEGAQAFGPPLPDTMVAPNGDSPGAKAAAAVTSGNGAARSTLQEETHAFMAAMAAKRRGNDAAALSGLDAFLDRYPHSPLAQNARVERFRLLRHMGRERAASDEARRYMAEHPDGFARGEARGMAVTPAPASSKNEQP